MTIDRNLLTPHIHFTAGGLEGAFSHDPLVEVIMFCIPSRDTCDSYALLSGVILTFPDYAANLDTIALPRLAMFSCTFKGDKTAFWEQTLRSNTCTGCDYNF
ncbi:hypothetical protein CSA56_11900 [candidate division KSB3 bacterium]|uniref:Uncharacterized protein n=1 Tax=candidate division KSB3 bacterium TaxID=2044937 RepID=A0A2G6KCF5_9BACT|nr:MAG: hypothetical protein CSA56_11900 [candidate division KSB3 bacterium]